MSWQKNRRRKRVWYQHYSMLASRLNNLVLRGRPIAGEAILKMFYDLYEERRLHKRQRIANSAYESMLLAAQDSNLVNLALEPQRYMDRAGNAEDVTGALERAPKPIDLSLTALLDPANSGALKRGMMGVDLARGDGRTDVYVIGGPIRSGLIIELDSFAQSMMGSMGMSREEVETMILEILQERVAERNRQAAAPF